jgi:hypothetical protein
LRKYFSFSCGYFSFSFLVIVACWDKATAILRKTGVGRMQKEYVMLFLLPHRISRLFFRWLMSSLSPNVVTCHYKLRYARAYVSHVVSHLAAGRCINWSDQQFSLREFDPEVGLG